MHSLYYQSCDLELKELGYLHNHSLLGSNKPAGFNLTERGYHVDCVNIHFIDIVAKLQLSFTDN